MLAQCLTRLDPDTALRKYEDRRSERTARVQLAARRNEVVFHLPDGDDQRRRDHAMADPDAPHPSAWIFGYDAMASSTAAPVAP